MRINPREFPIDDRLPGWFFRVDERSAGVYVVEGRDALGRSVTRTGTDPDPEVLLHACVEEARAIEAASPGWGAGACHACRAAALHGCASPLMRLAEAAGPIFLCRCGVCGAFWEESPREAHTIGEAPARERFSCATDSLAAPLAPAPLRRAVARRAGAPQLEAERACIEVATTVLAERPRESLLNQRITLIQRLCQRYPALDPTEPRLVDRILADTGAAAVGATLTLADGTRAVVEQRSISPAGGVHFRLRSAAGEWREHEFFD